MNEKDRVLSVEKAADLLFCFSKEKRKLSLQDFVKITGWKRTTLYRLLNSLVLKGLIKKDKSSGTYELGLPLLRLSSLVSDGLELRKESWEVMNDLSQSTNETINLNICEDARRVCIEKIDSGNMIRQHITVGQSYSLLNGASGKVLLAFSPNEFIEGYLFQHLNEAERQSVHQELEAIRQQGFAFSKNERVDGAFALSAPIYTQHQLLAGCLTIAGLSSTINEEKQTNYTFRIIEATKLISIKMGFTI